MKHHIMIALGLLLAAIFGSRMALAILEPGLGFTEIYLLGGLVLAGWLVASGLKERRFAKGSRKNHDS